MHVAARRPYLAAGVALVGASVIAASSVSPLPDVHLPEVHLPAISAAKVNLAALANPLEVYAQVFQTALANLGQLADDAVPGQLLHQIVANQLSSAGTLGAGLATTGQDIEKAAAQLPATVATAASQLAAGNVSGAVNTLLGVPLSVALPVTDLLPALQTILTKPLQNIINVINSFKDPLATQLLLAGFIAPLISTPAAAAVAVQNVLNAVGTGDLSAVVNAIVTAPATIADGLLNGGYGPDLAPIVGQTGVIVKAGGLFGSSTATLDANGNVVVNTGGPFAALEQLINQITKAITPPAAVVAKVAPTDPASITAVASSTLGLATATAPAAPAAPGSVPAKTAATDDTAPGTDSGSPVQDSTEASSETSAAKPAASTDTATDATKGAADASASTPTATKGDDTSATKGSTSKDGSEASSPSKKPTGTDADGATGNKVEPKSPTSGHPTKSGGGSTATSDKDGAATGSAASSAGDSAKGAGKGSEKGSEKGATKKAASSKGGSA
jgi:hypothetical protein